MGPRRRRRRLELGSGLRLCALLGLLLTPAALSIKQTPENHEVKISMHPTDKVQISGDSSIHLHDSHHMVDKEATKEEEKTLNSLVGLLQDMVKNIPTEQASTEGATIVITATHPNPSQAAGSVWGNMNPKAETTEAEHLVTISDVHKVASSTTTPFWKPRNDESAAVVLHTAANNVEKNLHGDVQLDISEPSLDVLSEQTTSEKPLVTVTVKTEKEKETSKPEVQNFDQLTNGALENLVESLNNVKKLQVSVDEADHKPEEPKIVVAHKTVSVGIFDLIDKLINTIRGAPSSVKEDPALRRYIEEAENYLKDALELASEAEKTLEEGQKMEEEKEKAEDHHKMQIQVSPHPEVSVPTEILKVEIASSMTTTMTTTRTTTKTTTTPAPTPEPTPEVTIKVIPSEPEPPPKEPPPKEPEILPMEDLALEVPTTPPPMAKEPEDAQVEMGKLKAFINLLYGFSPHLTAYTKNMPDKEAAEDIVNRAMAVLDAIKSIFCGSSAGKSKEMLQQMLKEDMELVKQAMKDKKAQ